MPVFSKPVVHTPRGAFRWMHDFLHADVMKSATALIERRLTALSLTTAFSGVCCPSSALHCLVAGFGRDAASRMVLDYHNSVEWDTECNYELSSLSVPPACQHEDITSFLTSTTRELIAELGDNPAKHKLEWIIMQRSGAVTTTAACRCHPDDTFCSYKWSWIHIAGPPCVDWSSNGLCQGLSGPTTVHLLSWLALVRLVRPYIIICENVVKWPHNYVHSWLAPVGYSMRTCILNSTMFAFPVERNRRYTVFTLDMCVTLPRPLSGRNGIESILGRDIGDSHSYLQYLIAPASELDCELMWASTRDDSPTATPLKSSDPRAFERSLTGYERKHLGGFREIQRGVAYTLSVNPADRVSKGKPTILHTLTAGQHLVWVDGNGFDRWVSGRELLAFQGLPTYLEWLDAICPGDPIPCYSFNYSRMRLGLPPRRRRHMTMQSGNGMHVAMVGAVILWCLRFVESAPSRIPPCVAMCICDDADDDRPQLDSFDVAFLRLSSKRQRARSSRSSVVSDAISVSGSVTSSCLSNSHASMAAVAIAVSDSDIIAPGSHGSVHVPPAVLCESSVNTSAISFDDMFSRGVRRKKLRV